MKIVPLFFLVGTVLGSTEAFLPTGLIATRRDDLMLSSSPALQMNRLNQKVSAEYQIYKETSGKSTSKLFQSSTVFNPTTGTVTSSSSQDVLYPPISHDTSVSKPISFQPSPLVKALASSTLFIFADVFIKQVFKSKGIGFPSSLAGCCAMAATLLVSPYHATMYQVLAPGAKLLQKLLMVFLVPNLIVLPLCSGCGSISEVLKAFSIISGGFLFSLLSTSYSVCAVRKFNGSNCADCPMPQISSPTTTTPAADIKPAAIAAAAAPTKAFSDEWTQRSRTLALTSGVAAWLAYHWQIGLTAISPLVAVSMLSATLHNFCFGARMPKKLTKILHPLVTCTTLTWVWSIVLGSATGSSFLSMIQGYRRGGALNLATSGAGDFLTFVLGPAVVSLGVSIYERRRLIQQNLKEVVTATGVSCIGGLFGTALAVRLLRLATSELRLSLLPRNITSALAVAIADIVGANKSLAVSFAVITGLIGANFGASLLDYFGIKDPVARGLGIGSAAHGLGTAAFVDEKDAFPFAAIGMTLTAICGTVLVSLPIVKKVALQIALGGL